MYQYYLSLGYRGGFETFLSYENGEFKNFGLHENPWNYSSGNTFLFNVRFADYYKFYQTYTDLFGEENVCVLPIELMIDDWEQYNEIFHEFTGHSFTIDDTPGSSDTSNSEYRSRANLIQRFINCFAKVPSNPFGFIPIQKRFLRVIRLPDIRILHKIVGRLLGGEDLLTDTLSAEIMNFHENNNQLLDQNTKADLSKYDYY